jgi:uncharacterized membrane protein
LSSIRLTFHLSRFTSQVLRRWGALFAAVLAAGVVVAWLWFTPEGVLGKADAVGYAVCHRIAGRSFAIAGRPLPLCARCSGLYLGALLAMVALTAAGRGRAAGLPPLRASLLLLGLLGIMGADGVNSYMAFFPGLPRLYEPQNWLRLTTGLLGGLSIGAFVLPAFNGTVWQALDPQPALRGVKEVLALAGLAGLLAAVILAGNAAVLYALALASSLTVLLVLSMIQVTLWLALLRRGNTVASWRGSLAPFAAGAALAVVQVAVIDAARYALTGTWAGFAL